MRNSYKKTLAREILILFGFIGLTLLIALGVWCYSLIITKMIRNKANEIKTYQASIINLTKDYTDKLSKIKMFIGLVKTNHDDNWVSSYSLYLLSKELNIDKAVNMYESEQSINGLLPNPSETSTIDNCLRPFREDILLQYGTINDYPDENVLSIWECFMTDKEHLFYLFPLPVIEYYKTDTRDKLFKLFQELQITAKDKAQKAHADHLLNQVTILEKEKKHLSFKVLGSNDLIKIFKIIFLILFVMVYPVRILYFSFRWAIKNYK
jgi:hypothetical protein